jgi:hypothetical protein
MREKLNRQVQFWAAAVTIFQIILAGVFFLWQFVSDHNLIVGSFSQVSSGTSEMFYPYAYKTYRNDTVQLKAINRYLKNEIPTGFIEYNSDFRKEYMLDIDRIRYKKLEDSLRSLTELLNPERFNRFGTTGGDCFQLTLANQGKKTLMNVKVDMIYNYRSGPQQSIYLEDANYPTTWYVDSIRSIIGSEEILIKELGPRKGKVMYVWPRGPYPPYSVMITYDGGSKEIYTAKSVHTTNAIDDYVTEMVLNNGTVQLFLYILTPLGLIYLVFYIVPYLQSFFKKKIVTNRSIPPEVAIFKKETELQEEQGQV